MQLSGSTYLPLSFQWLCTPSLHSLRLLGVSWLPLKTARFYLPWLGAFRGSSRLSRWCKSYTKSSLHFPQSLQLDKKNFQVSFKTLHFLSKWLRKLIEQPPCFLAISPPNLTACPFIVLVPYHHSNEDTMSSRGRTRIDKVPATPGTKPPGTPSALSAVTVKLPDIEIDSAKKDRIPGKISDKEWWGHT